MRSEKHLLKDEVKSKIERHGAFIVMKYTGFGANTANAFRREVGKMGGEMEVVRKRILFKAGQDVGIHFDPSDFTGHIGLVFLGKDPIETLKAVFKFSQTNNKVFQIHAGRFDGKLYNGADVEKLSKLPGINDMRAEFLGLLEAPMAQTLAVMEALLSSVVYCLDNKTKQAEDVAVVE